MVEPLVRFGDLVDDLGVDAERLPCFAQCSARTVSRNSSGNRGAVATVLAIDVLDDLFATLVLEVDVDVRRLAALFRDETFEKHVAARGVDLGHAEAVAHGAVSSGTAPLAEDVLAASEADDVIDCEEI